VATDRSFFGPEVHLSPSASSSRFVSSSEERIYPVAAPQHSLARPDTPPADLLYADLLVHVVHPERHTSRFDWNT
jgi:hypothetical protein